jgi:hypothetical protein
MSGSEEKKLVSARDLNCDLSSQKSELETSCLRLDRMLTRAVLSRGPLSCHRFHRLPVIPRRPLRIARAYSATEKEYSQSSKTPTRRENIYTLPNLLTTSRIIACPILGWSIIQGNFPLATGLLLYAGISDLVRLSFSTRFTQH